MPVWAQRLFGGDSGSSMAVPVGTGDDIPMWAKRMLNKRMKSEMGEQPESNATTAECSTGF